MFDVKRKPNSPGSRGSAATALLQRSSDLGTSTLASQPPAIHGVTAVPPSTHLNTTATRVIAPASESREYQTRLPMIIGEAQYKGTLHLDGIANGQLGGNGGSLNVRQRSRSYFSEPEFSGEVRFRDMIRVNGHIAGTVYSKKGTLIVDVSAIVAANVDVAVAVIRGTVTGDVIARQRVEIGPNARIYGNISTRSIEIKNGAIFEGVCRMFAEEQIAG